MSNDTLITELTKLYNNKLLENNRVNGLIIKIYKRLRKELHKYNSSKVNETLFHKDIATYAAGIIGYYSNDNSLSSFLVPKLKHVYHELKIIQQPFVFNETKEQPDEKLLFRKLTQINKNFDLNEPNYFKLFRILQKIYLLKRNQSQGLAGISHVELITMSTFFNFWPKKNYWDKDWTVPIFSYFCWHKEWAKSNLPAKKSNNSFVSKPTKEFIVSEINPKNSNLNKDIKLSKNQKRGFWSWFRK